MATSSAATVAEYLAELPEERRAVVSAVRDAVRRHLPAGYEEQVGWGMISWVVPLARCPDTYNGQPLCYAALAAQKRHYALHLMGVYASEESTRRLRDGFAAAGRKLDMGKSCVRFTRLEDLPLDVVGAAIAATPPDAFVAQYHAARAAPRSGRAKG